jgi:acetoin utilization deacetylase AcuC-like enzyme
MIVITTDHAAHDPDRLAPTGDGRRYWERPERIDALLAALRDGGYPTAPARDHGLGPVERVHDPAYLQFLASAFARYRETPGAGPALRPHAFAVRHLAKLPQSVFGQAGYYLATLGAPVLEGTWQAAVRSAHAAVDAADQVLAGESHAYALCRPPGHHAGTDLTGGFCYLNNAAIAAQRLLDAGAGPVAILDVDVHHGNGTQQIFYARDDVRYVSVHGDPAHLYPYYAGYADETGSGPGVGRNLNLPLAPGSGDAAFVEAVEHGLDAIARQPPSVLLVSLGFDAHDGDPTANLAVSAAAFEAIGTRIAQLARPILLVQEGGYIIERLGANLTSFLSGLFGAPAKRETSNGSTR